MQFLSFFIPLFITIDSAGLAPVFLAVTTGMSTAERRRISFQAVGAATFFTLAFMLLGNWLFSVLGISSDDFRIAGGVLLLVLAVIDLIISGKPAVHEDQMVGIVPLATPLIAGPATLTTVLVLASRENGYAMTTLSLAANFAVVLAVLLYSESIARLVGINAIRAVSKFIMILLAAIAVNFIRIGITHAITGH
jgi:multiple antibiotic resistance protein